MSTIEIKKITLYRSYDLLFLGYYEYSLRLWCREKNISFEIKSPRHADITYSPRNVGIRGQLYFEIESIIGIKRCFVDISDGYSDIRVALLKEVDVYYKCNCSMEYVKGLDIADDLKRKIKPSGLFMPLNFLTNTALYKYKIKSFFEMVGFDRDSSLSIDIKRWKTNITRAGNLSERPTKDFYNKNRGINKFENDIFYSAATWVDVENELMLERAELISNLRGLDQYKVHAEFIYNKKAKKIFPDLMIDHKRELSEYFEIMKNSKIVVIHKSLSGGAISWRVGECLALGKVYIHEYSPNDFYTTKLLDDYLGVYHKSADLIEKLQILLKDKNEFQRLQKESLFKYEYYFNPINTADYLVNGAF